MAFLTEKQKQKNSVGICINRFSLFDFTYRNVLYFYCDHVLSKTNNVEAVLYVRQRPLLYLKINFLLLTAKNQRQSIDCRNASNATFTLIWHEVLGFMILKVI